MSLTMLGMCINARAGSATAHAPYRDSKLTRLLKARGASLTACLLFFSDDGAGSAALTPHFAMRADACSSSRVLVSAADIIMSCLTVHVAADDEARWRDHHHTHLALTRIQPKPSA